MQAQGGTDFSKINWSKIDREKAVFIYEEAKAILESFHENMESLTTKAFGLLTISLSIMTALVGFIVISWGNISPPLFAASICAIVFLLAILVVLLLIILPKGTKSAQMEPSSYFEDGYYLREMEDIYKGNIRILQDCIDKDHKVLMLRAGLFKAAVLLFACFPVITAIVAAIRTRF
jgi:magnesium-transporting ATPase (P-type)